MGLNLQIYQKRPMWRHLLSMQKWFLICFYLHAVCTLCSSGDCLLDVLLISGGGGHTELTETSLASSTTIHSTSTGLWNQFCPLFHVFSFCFQSPLTDTFSFPLFHTAEGKQQKLILITEKKSSTAENVHWKNMVRNSPLMLLPVCS